MTRMSFIAIAVVCVLALPASAIAQSAGDNQYQDPLATPHHGSSGSTRSSGGSGSATPSQGSSSGSAAGTSGSSGAGSQSSSGTSAAAGSGRLPRTGGHPELGALLGLALLTGGLGLRRAAGTGRT